MYYKIIRIKVGCNKQSKKKYIVFASLVLALSAAVYINWQLSGAKTPQSAKELGAASYVSATASASDDEVQQTAALSNESKSYFSAEKKFSILKARLMPTKARLKRMLKSFSKPLQFRTALKVLSKPKDFRNAFAI